MSEVPPWLKSAYYSCELFWLLTFLISHTLYLVFDVLLLSVINKKNKNRTCRHIRLEVPREMLSWLKHSVIPSTVGNSICRLIRENVDSSPNPYACHSWVDSLVHFHNRTRRPALRVNRGNLKKHQDGRPRRQRQWDNKLMAEYKRSTWTCEIDMISGSSCLTCGFNSFIFRLLSGRGHHFEKLPKSLFRR